MEIATDCLIPRIPQRVNYILWIEDLFQERGNEVLSGIDIGCGASCIFSILACAMNPNWIMIASDIDEKNIECAQANVSRNNLNEKINSEECF